MKNGKKKEYHCETPDIGTVASATECTGLMCRPPVNMEEYASYRELYGMETPKADED